MPEQPIRNKRLDLATAPTPQNTPSTTAPIMSHAQQPGVSSIKEEDVGRSEAASVFAQNPKLVKMIQGRLGTLVGRSSGYVESLPWPVRRRISGLKGIQKEHSKLEAEFQEAVFNLEKQFFAKFSPLYEKRSRIINGHLEPTDEEVQAGEDDDGSTTDEKDDNAAGKAVKSEEEVPHETGDQEAKEASAAASAKGVPEFWLSAMKNEISLADMITERDEAVLVNLVDIRMEYLDMPGFRLIFEFGPNDFFTNETITKSYFYQAETGYSGDFIYDHAEGDKIEWKEGKDLTVRIESKKQRNKNTMQTRIVRKTVPTESFFNFFSPPQVPADDDASTASEMERRLELDYKLGEDIKENLIPHAVDWFTGDALGYEELKDGDMETDEDDEDNLSDDADEDEESDDDDEEGGKPKNEAAECKQS